MGLDLMKKSVGAGGRLWDPGLGGGGLPDFTGSESQVENESPF
jgi:hypothetical protein